MIAAITATDTVMIGITMIATTMTGGQRPLLAAAQRQEQYSAPRLVRERAQLSAQSSAVWQGLSRIRQSGITITTAGSLGVWL